MRPLTTPPGGAPKAGKRKADDDLADLMVDMTLGNGKAPSKRARSKSPEPAGAEPAVSASARKRKASIDESGEGGPSAVIAESAKRSRLVPEGQSEKMWDGGDRDFRNPDGSSVHKPLAGPVTVHFGHGTVIIGNGSSVKIDHPDGTTVLSLPGEEPTIIKPFGKPRNGLPGGGRVEHLGNGDTRVYLPDRVVTHFGTGLTRTEIHPGPADRRGFYETDSDGAHRFVPRGDGSE